jgi:hypothetical protein
VGEVVSSSRGKTVPRLRYRVLRQRGVTGHPATRAPSRRRSRLDESAILGGRHTVLDPSGASTYLRGEDERNLRPRCDVSFAFPRGPARLAGHGWPEPHSCLLDAAFDISMNEAAGRSSALTT